MTWTAPTPPILADGPLTGADRPILQGFLAWERTTLRSICADLTGEQLARRAIPPSNLSLLGIVRHLTKVERIWFRLRAGGQDIEPAFDPARGKDADFDEIDAEQAEHELSRYRQECLLGDEAAAGLSFDEEFSVHGEAHSLRLIYVHMIAEYSRHNGHADLLREVIDGTTGR